MNEKLTMKSSLREVYTHPVGHDILKKIMLQTGMQERLLDNRITGAMSLQAVAALTKKILDDSFWQTFLNLLNSEPDYPDETDSEIVKNGGRRLFSIRFTPGASAMGTGTESVILRELSESWITFPGLGWTRYGFLPCMIPPMTITAMT